jgi:hypothetical protein
MERIRHGRHGQARCDEPRLGTDRLGTAGASRHGPACSGGERHRRRGVERVGTDRRPTAGMARTALHGRARPCRRGDGMKRIRHGEAGEARQGELWTGAIWHGRHGRHGEAWRGPVGRGLDWHRRSGSTRQGVAGRGPGWHCRHGEAGIGPARRGMVRLAELGVVAHQRGRDFLPPTLFLI